MALSSEVRTEPHVTFSSAVRFHPLFFREPDEPGKEWIVGYVYGDVALALPEIGMAAIKSLQSGETVGQVSATLCERMGDDIDVVDLVCELHHFGLVERIDDRAFSPPEQVRQKWLARIPPKALAWLYTPTALIVQGLVIFAGICLLLFDSPLRPQVHDVLWSRSYAVDMLTLLLLSPLLLLKHELGHLLAARSRGLNGVLTFGHRLFYLVAVSRIAGIWTLRQSDRLLIYGAGMLSDCLTASLGVLLLFAVQRHVFVLTPEVNNLIGLLVISEYTGIFWEFQVFLKTDVYHVLADLTDRHDLPERTRTLLLRCWKKLIGQAVEQQKREPVARDGLIIGYTCLSVAGILASYLCLLLYFLPASLSALEGEWTLFRAGLRLNDWLALLDAMIALLFQMLSCFLLCWSWYRTFRLSRRYASTARTS